MTGPWSADWSYAYLRALMTKVASRRRFAVLSAAPDALARPEPVAFVRHDVDMSLERALALAEREAEWGIVATYHVMLSSPFYDVASAASRAALRTIASLGHEVGLHFHAPQDGVLDHADEADEVVARACDRFEEITGIAPLSVSFHLPAATSMGGPLLVGGRVNAYAGPLVAWYLSDSRARWREGEPKLSLDAPRAEHLQLLVHPVWWGELNELPAVRLHALVEALAAERGQSIEEISDRVYDHILVRSAPAPR